MSASEPQPPSVTSVNKCRASPTPPGEGGNHPPGEPCTLNPGRRGSFGRGCSDLGRKEPRPAPASTQVRSRADSRSKFNHPNANTNPPIRSRPKKIAQYTRSWSITPGPPEPSGQPAPKPARSQRTEPRAPAEDACTSEPEPASTSARSHLPATAPARSPDHTGRRSPSAATTPSSCFSSRRGSRGMVGATTRLRRPPSQRTDERKRRDQKPALKCRQKLRRTRTGSQVPAKLQNPIVQFQNVLTQIRDLNPKSITLRKDVRRAFLTFHETLPRLTNHSQIRIYSSTHVECDERNPQADSGVNKNQQQARRYSWRLRAPPGAGGVSAQYPINRTRGKQPDGTHAPLNARTQTTIRKQTNTENNAVWDPATINLQALFDHKENE